MNFDSIKELIKNSGLTVKHIGDSRDDWDVVLSAVKNYDVDYDLAAVDYHHLYFSSVLEFQQQAMVFFASGKPVAVWPLSISQSEGKSRIGSNGSEVLPPLLLPNLAEKVAKKVVNSAHLILTEIKTAKTATCTLKYNMLSDGCSLWYKSLQDKYKLFDVTHFLYVDLNRDLDLIKGGFRKSFRPLVSKGLRSWNIDIFADSCADVFEEFRLLHIAVAGRETRPKSTWDELHASLISGKGFLITLRDDEGILVGGGYFRINQRQGLYGVGVYKRELFDQPLGHAVQYKAIEYMKSQGLTTYCIGQRPYPHDRNTPTDKEVQIGYFKEGFATHMYPAFIFSEQA
ncbi:FemAB family protein [Moritella sp. 28]|uniref:FemAB family protein n=1 Tax=Moritella sp. 28 TaxID=2746232 RepID=UPI001BA9097F|nr:FemAB family protein [Moritella sp. 28]QUM83614.1 FemAB family protein [Moritella sp. 28]